jgi:DNA-binding LytR/AlgR family response regulator
MGVFTASWIVPRAWFEDRRWLAGGTIVGVISVPLTLLVTLTSTLIHHRVFGLDTVLEDFPSTLATTAAMTGLAFLMEVRAATAETHAAPPGAAPPKFLGRLPQRLRGADLWAVQAEDHYLRLHTSLGQDLILMRLGDAIAELEGIEGAQTHRSWWVARAAVKDAARADGRATLTLEGGIEAPVSRAYAKGLRDAGWF